MTLRFRKEHLFTILLLCSSILASFLLAEAVLGFLLPNSYFIWPPHLQRIFKPREDIMPGISGEARFVVNSLGLRGDDPTPSHAYRILAIGGSTTECLYLDQSETWTHLLQKTLNENSLNRRIWVGNAGVSGSTTRHHLMAMQYLPLTDMKIDAILLLIGVNDLIKRLAQDDVYDKDFLAKPESVDRIFAETFRGGEIYQLPNDRFLKKTAVWQMLRKMVLQKPVQHNVQDDGGEIYVKLRKHRQQAAGIRNELPDLSSALDEYARNIHKMIDIGQNKSIRLIFMTQPTIWRSGLSHELDALLWFGGIGNFQREPGHIYYSSEALEKGMQNYNNTLLKICHERRVECMDLASMLKKDTTVFYDDVHFNESGAREVAHAVSNYFLSQDPFRGVALLKDHFAYQQ